jgi:protein involved in polysaccharide export with SLBB domain
MTLRVIGLTLLLLVGVDALFTSSVAAEDSSYRLAIGDRVKVAVFGHEDLSGEFEVGPSGAIVMPLIHDVPARDRTVAELERAIIDALSPGYLKHPRVSVEVLTYRPINVLGEVIKPGSYPYVNGMTVVNAIAVAGGFTYRARKGKITIQREDQGNAVKISAAMETLVKPGDVIDVPERFF